MRAVALMILGVVAAISGCAEVPEEAVTLSVTVGRDLEETHRSHRALAERYFARTKTDVNAFVDEQYAPYITEHTLNDPVSREGGQSTTILDLIVAEARKEGGGRTLAFMGSTVEKINRQINSFRAELVAPIEAREREVLRAIDDAYARIQNAHAVVTGHLASVRKVQLAQQEVLEAVGLKDLRRNVIDTTAQVSDRIADLTARARRGEAKVDAAALQLCEFVHSVRTGLDEGPDARAEAAAACRERVAGAGGP